MKINKITGSILFILSVFTIVYSYFVGLLGINEKFATNIIILDVGIFLIIGLVWFVSLFFVKKEEGNKIKIFFKLIGKLLLVLVVYSLAYLFFGYPSTVGDKSAFFGIVPNKTYFINKISGVNRGSIISYVISKDGYEFDQLGRVIGLPNEKIVVKQRAVEINGNLYSEKDIDWSKWGKGDVFNYELKDSEYLVTFDLARTLESVHVVSKQSIKGVIK